MYACSLSMSQWLRATPPCGSRWNANFDLMIACTAIEHEAALVTHDTALKDGAIGGLVVENWLDSGP